MSEEEYELLDELYFVQPYGYLKETLNWEDEALLATLQELYSRELIKCMIGPDEELFEGVDIVGQGKNYYFLATKKGLMEHNTL
ncbi:hypothetical protein KZP23_00395 [Echinicola marina]|uniref:hypothetical protein n=1 Tax=Echinicola marina TaxID=2859768 RepID=UPI001CF6D1D4|nr:hypothetical protein [Echinicola marina]UCS93536.1 hypothetical protein KZP23_00395 [Echinicola marina]